jgi:ribosomal protein S5
VRATINALSAMESPETVALRRGKKAEEISWVKTK